MKKTKKLDDVMKKIKKENYVMKKAKKILVGLTMLTMLFSLPGCGVKVNSSDSSAKEAEVTKDVAVDKPAATSDTEKVVLKVIDWSDSTKARREEFHKKFMEENPNVTIEYTVLTADQFRETVVVAIKSGNAPDLFPIPSGMKLSAVLEENWYTPMNDYVTDEFIASFSDGALNEGITNLEGKVYVLPEAANIINTLMFYNKTVLKEAGIDEANLPKTWSEFIKVTKQISEAGKGKFFGMIDSGAQVNRLELAIRSFASLAGAKSSDIAQIMLVDGKNTLNSEAMIKAFDFYDTLVKEGALHPNSVALKAPEARALFAQNQAAFIIQGSWCIPTWRKDNPDLDFGVMALPIPDDGEKGKLPYVGAQPWMGISAKSAHPDVAGKYLMALYSEEYQSNLVKDGGFVSAISSVNTKAMVDEVMLNYYTLHNKAAALAPDPIVANVNAAMVYPQVTAISPGLGEIVQGVLAQGVDYKAELETLSGKAQAEWEKAIKAVNDAGTDISLADFEFKNWNPMENYTAEKYNEK